MTADEICDHLLHQAEFKARILVAIAGPPGSGKSTLAESLADNLTMRGESCVVVPMDGFHLDNRILQQRDILHRKGAPHTFDASGFVHLLRRLRAAGEDVFIPVFDRSRDIAIAGANVVSATTRFLLVEGNYLLLKDASWNELAQLWDETVFLNPGLDVIEQRLIQRWLDNGLSYDAARERALGNDIPNAKTVLQNSCVAGLTIA